MKVIQWFAYIIFIFWILGAMATACGRMSANNDNEIDVNNDGIIDYHDTIHYLKESIKQHEQWGN